MKNTVLGSMVSWYQEMCAGACAMAASRSAFASLSPWPVHDAALVCDVERATGLEPDDECL